MTRPAWWGVGLAAALAGVVAVGLFSPWTDPPEDAPAASGGAGDATAAVDADGAADDDDVATDDDGLPALDSQTAAATIAWLEGEGRTAARMHEHALALLAEPDDCEATIARLSDEAPADEVFAAAVGIPDEVLADASLSQRSALGLSLEECAMAPEHLEELEELTGRVATRLASARELSL